MKRWVVAIVSLLALLLALAMLVVGLMAQPEIVHEKRSFKISPTTTSTGTPVLPTPINKSTLIIQQNQMCWIGLPGATCGVGRTYV